MFKKQHREQMTREEIFYLIPYIISLAITLGVLLYSWKHPGEIS